MCAGSPLLAGEDALVSKTLVYIGAVAAPGVSVAESGLAQISKFPRIIRRFGKRLQFGIARGYAFGETQHARVFAPHSCSERVVDVIDFALPRPILKTHDLLHEVQQTFCLIYDHRGVMAGLKTRPKGCGLTCQIHNLEVPEAVCGKFPGGGKNVFAAEGRWSKINAIAEHAVKSPAKSQ
jgi:hypothetical protein